MVIIKFVSSVTFSDWQHCGTLSGDSYCNLKAAQLPLTSLTLSPYYITGVVSLGWAGGDKLKLTQNEVTA